MDAVERSSPGPAVRVLLRSVVGSRLHGTDTPASDTDVRSVFLQPTSVVLSVRPKYETHVKEPGRDENAWELGHFLGLCLKGSPTTLEVLLAAPETSCPEGEELRALFPHFLGKKSVSGAFWGFAAGEKKTMLSPNSGRTLKSGGHYLRVLFNGVELLKTGRMTVRIVDTPIGQTVLAAKQGRLSAEEVLRIGAELEREFEEANRASSLPDRPDLAPINEFLLRVRKANW